MHATTTWRTLQNLFSEIYTLQPWTFLEETDVFGIHSPLTDKNYFISIMGYQGILKAVAAYDGLKALGQFWDLEESGTESGDILTIPHFILSYEPEEYMDINQLNILRSINTDFGYSKEWPEIKYIESCHFPKDPNDSQLNELILIFEQTLEVCKRAEKNPDLIYSDKEDDEIYFMREMTKDGNRWIDKFRKFKVPMLSIKQKWNRKDIDILLTLPLSQVVLQAHFQILPLKIKGENDTLYFPVTVILTQKKSGYIENNELLSPLPDYETMLGKIPGLILDFIKALGFRPRCIEVKNPLLFEMIYTPLQLSAIKLVFKDTLPSVEEAISSFLESIEKDNKDE
jgi:hypothetical protein